MSSVITSLTPNQVNDELHKMQQFILKEAQEKAREIQLKADQEYEIEKTAVVRQETASLDANYAARLKAAALKQQIGKSTVANRMRLKVLAERDTALADIFAEARQSLAKKLQGDAAEYKRVMRGLIRESLLRLLEPQVVLRCREQDIPLVESLAKELASEYEQETGGPVEITTLSKPGEHCLPGDALGGVLVSDPRGKVTLDNTLDERLVLLSQEALPAIRLELFGISKTRKFFD
ncbi:H(+)-transporting V1 sector ATPase subunit E KNAG_0E00490 [Huiozyma naganishii CBS 8797]|uniref:V-type proton ATPase subunit E n=1 Tax=Huiozyma naganishii (strain ATCC MYA-139 / BCRC 22969 / CBS 8797 / KCTC 17520 / NBRC 10181 / NCYC 3082 / Yp74L-3) TaxID=1071383 RepID=J7RYR3_HUIN7|nr:hypothetical protein KNAG_0E00490 [Kazachstania naganishii CBS 8797]CCK70317.1 hypothetical protein KNAG_0E00490 [Kazachstania naganishii CBS 8797]